LTREHRERRESSACTRDYQATGGNSVAGKSAQHARLARGERSRARVCGRSCRNSRLGAGSVRHHRDGTRGEGATTASDSQSAADCSVASEGDERTARTTCDGAHAISSGSSCWGRRCRAWVSRDTWVWSKNSSATRDRQASRDNGVTGKESQSAGRPRRHGSTRGAISRRCSRRRHRVRAHYVGHDGQGCEVASVAHQTERPAHGTPTSDRSEVAHSA
jgi:hypothetical protein